MFAFIVVWPNAAFVLERFGILDDIAAFTALRFQKTAGITMADRGLASSLFNRDEAFFRCKYDFGVTVNPCIPRQTRRKYL